MKNLGPLDTFRAVARDDHGLIANVLPVQFGLASNRKTKVSVRLMPPAAGALGTIDTLTFSVESTTAGGAHNFAVIDSAVTSHP